MGILVSDKVFWDILNYMNIEGVFLGGSDGEN